MREDWFEEQLLEYKQYFKRRNYKNCVIHKGFDKARNIPRSQALKPKTASDQTVCNFVLILDYDPNSISMYLSTRITVRLRPRNAHCLPPFKEKMIDSTATYINIFRHTLIRLRTGGGVLMLALKRADVDFEWKQE